MTGPDPAAPPLAHPSAQALRWNGVLTALLLAALAVLGTSLAQRHLRWRQDFSEDGLHTIAPATRRVVGRIEDTVTVRLFATEEVEDGAYALRTARIRSQLEEILALRPTAFELQVLDPTVSSEARDRAGDAGFRPRTTRGGGLAGGSYQDVWLSLELAYRGRVARIPEPMPWQFETQFASRLHGLLSDRRVGVGWFGAPLDPPPEATPGDPASMIAATYSRFTQVRALLGQGRRDVEVRGLAEGRPVPEEVDVLFVVRPGQLHAREVYALDQFVQRGGRMVVCLDGPDYSPLTGTARADRPDLEGSQLVSMLRSWGAEASANQVWDKEWQSPRPVLVAGAGGAVPVVLDDPMVITVREEGLNGELPPTQALPAVRFFWAHPLATEAMAPTPAGVTRTDLVTSSASAWLNLASLTLPRNPAEARTMLVGLQQRTAPARFTLAAAFTGRFPSPWAGEDPPEPRASALGVPAPPDPGPPRSAEVDATVVVVGDADWLRDPLALTERAGVRFAAAGGATLAENLVDWLSLDEELIGLRSRQPRPRPLRDFVAEEEARAGVFEPDPFETGFEQAERSAKRDDARRRARRKQWLVMLVPALGALVVVALFGALWNGLQRRTR